jgi:hypothetical protein
MYRGVTSRKQVDFIVLSTMRSGSNNLQDTLNGHPEIECGGEVFNPRHVQIWRKVYLEHQNASPAEIVGLKAAVVVARYGKRWFPEVMLRIARRPLGRDMFGFRLFGDHVQCFGLDPLLERLHTHGTKFIHLVRRDTFDQALSLVRAQATGIWKITSKTPAPTAPLDLPSLAARVKWAAELLHGHKVVTASIARRYGALLLDFDEYTRDEQSYDRIQDFLGVRARVALRHSNMKTPPIDVGLYWRLRDELERSGAPMRFNPEAM